MNSDPLNLKFLMIYLLLFSPLLANIYAFSSVSWGDLSILFFLFFYIKKFGISNASSSIIFLCFAFLISFYYLFNFESGFFVSLRIFFYLFSFSIVFELYKHKGFSEKLLFTYIRLAQIFSFLLIIQVLFYYFFGVTYIYIQTSHDIEINSVLSLMGSEYGMRTGGVFKEPSYFAIFIFPAILYSVRFKKYYTFLLFAVSVICSTSALGFLFLLICILVGLKRNKISLLALSFCFFIFFLITYKLDMLPARVGETINGEGSFFVRFSDPLIYVFDRLHNLILPGLKELSFDEVEWLNSLSYVFIVTGILAIPLLITVTFLSGESLWAALLLLILTNSLTTPYFLIVMLTMRIVNNQFRKSEV